MRLEALRESIIKDLKLRLFAFRPEQVLPAGLSLQKLSWIDAMRQRIPETAEGASPRPNATVFRKHKIFLLKRTLIPFLALVLSIAVTLGASGRSTTRAAMRYWSVPVVSAVWLFIQYENWRNDEYILTDSHIIDIEASALRLKRKATAGRVGESAERHL